MSSQLDMYKANQSEIVKGYNGQIIAVKDGVVQGAYPSKLAALRDMQSKGFEAGTYMIIKCTEGENEYTAVFHSRVSFKPTGAAFS